MAHPNRLRAVVGAVVLLVCLGAVTGCGGDDKTGVATAADELSADAASSPAAGTDEQASSEPSPASAVEGLPPGFPADDVPLLREKVLTGSAGGPDGEIGWSVVLQSSRAVSEVSAQVREAFGAAGYAAGPGNELGDLSVMEFEGPKYDVGVTAARTEGHVVITYVVRDAG
jgi:hypothetical protein